MNSNRAQVDAIAFWKDVFPHDAVALVYLRAIFLRSLIFVAVAFIVCLIELEIPNFNIAIDISPFEVGGAVLSILLVLRTNAGYERWWEARKLWGAIVNHSRSLVTAALAYGPADPQWRSNIARWTAAFAHATRLGLRGDRDMTEIASLIGAEAAVDLAGTRHLANHVALRLADLLQECQETSTADWALLQMERERMSLVDSLGACERIMKTPMPRAYAISLRQFIVAFLVTLPLGVVGRAEWLTPLVTLFVTFPLLAMDQIAADLQKPFVDCRLNSLPLDDICATIQGDVLALVGESAADTQA